MNNTAALNWAKDFENKSISELEALGPPSGMYPHIAKHWQKARLAAIDAGKAALNPVRSVLVQQIAARADQLSAAENAAVEAPVVSSNEEQNREFNSADRAENLRERIAAAIARNNEPVPEQTLKPATAPMIFEGMLPLEAMTSQLSSSAEMVSGLVREFRENEFPAHVVCEIAKSMSVLIVANAALGKVVHQFQEGVADSSRMLEGRRSNAR